MPAVQLARLKAEIQDLSWQFANPAEYSQGLRELLERYADRVYRPSETQPRLKRVQGFRVPALVLNQIELELERLSRENPGASLLLAEALWKQPYRNLTAGGFFNGQGALSTTRSRAGTPARLVPGWRDAQLTAEVLKQGSARLRRDQHELWLQFARGGW